jgi:hypothetical protein
MATRAEQFRSAVERSRPSPQRPQPSRGSKKTAQRTVNRSTHLAKKATFKLEEVVGHARPSRKSTRKAANRMKPDSNLERRQKRETHSPETRARKASAQRSRAHESLASRRPVR